MKVAIALITLVLFGIVGLCFAQTKEKVVAKPNVAGAWTGTWGALETPKPGAAPKPYTGAQRAMDCKVEVMPSGEWQATFEGECGRPYKYTIKMPGRQSGEVVLFKGSVDLGEKDGGVYDWIGRAAEHEFIGFFTSRGHAGSFTLARPKSAEAK